MEAQTRSTAYRQMAELFVIILGVLIALGVDAWWQRIQDGHMELEALTSLSSDLDAAEVLVKRLVTRDEKMIEKSVQLTLDKMERIQDRQTSDLLPLFATVPREVRLRTYDELTATGKLRLISNRELRLLLTDFDSLAKSLAGYDKQMEVQWNETARPILYRTYSFEMLSGGEPLREKNTFPKASDLDLFELRNAVIDRGNYARVHLSRTEELLELLSILQARTTEALEAAR